MNIFQCFFNHNYKWLIFLIGLVCQFGGDQACSVECVAKGYLHGGHCDSNQVCICNPSLVK
jgi:hypothetical protein